MDRNGKGGKDGDYLNVIGEIIPFIYLKSL